MLRNALLATLAGVAFTCGPAHAQIFLGKNVNAWLKELDQGNDVARRSAAHALGKVGSGDALPALKRHLRTDKDARVRDECAFALGEIARRALNVAGQDAKLVDVLSEALAADDNPLVRRSAAFALGCLGSDAIAALPMLTNALNDKTPVVRQNAAWALAKLGKPAVPALKQALHDADPLVKRDAARAMEPMESAAVREAITDLAGLCKENHLEVRRAALATLIKNVHPEDAREAGMIQAALSDADEEVRNFAALTLANIGGQPAQAAVPQLLAALKQQNIVELRRQAAAGIRNIGPFAKAAVPDLIKLLRDQDAEVRSNAALALGGIGPDAVAAYVPLLQLLENTEERPETRIEAAYSLSRMGRIPAAVEAVPRQLKILGNPAENAKVRERIMWAIRVHNEELRRMPNIYPTFTKILTEPKNVENRMLRYDCAYMLGMLQNKDVEPPVMETLHEFLLDDTIQIFVGKNTKVKATGVETNSGESKTEERGKGDGRVMALQALLAIGPGKVQTHPGVMTELRKLAARADTYAELKEMCVEMLKKIGR